MRIVTPLIIILLFFAAVHAHAQQQIAIEGKVLDNNKDPLPRATVQLVGSDTGTITGKEGKFILKLNNEGPFSLTISSVGYQSRSLQLLADGKTKPLVIVLQEATLELGEIVVTGESEKTLLETSALAVEAIELQDIKAEASDLTAILTRTAGINIRQSAGVGSSVRINLNGLQGKAISFFRDGIPTDYLGNTFNIAFLSPNTLERVDVYKGIVPVELGADALGGALNFISKKNRQNIVELSHEVASYNTHRSAINAYYKNDADQFVKLTSFFNYSDNNYKVDVKLRNPDTRNLEDIRAERFHDTFLSSFSELQLGALNLTWADEISISGGASLSRDDVQNSLQMIQAFGRARLLQDGFFGALNYRKSLNDRLSIDFFGAHGQHTTSTIDTALQVFNWLGEVERRQGFTRGEVNNGNISLAEFMVNEWVGRLLFKYEVSQRHSLTFNNVTSRKKRVGEDPFGLRVTDDNIDPLTVPARLVKNVTGVEIKSNWLDGKLTTRGAIKNYYFRNSGIDFGNAFIAAFDPIVNSGNLFGGSATAKYQLNRFLLFRASYEYATRIPDEDEIYGDGLFLRSNPELRPERSHNLNVGFRIDKIFSGNRSGYLEFSTFLRSTQDRIFARISTFDVINDNGPAEEALGAELDFALDITSSLSFNGNATFQDIRLTEATDFTEEFLVGERFPNIPYFFFNTGLRYKRADILKNTILTAFAYQSFVEEYFLFFRASPKVQPPTIPQRNIIRAGVTAEVKNWTVTAESNNLFNADVFEEFREQRPGRTWHLKVNYRFLL